MFATYDIRDDDKDSDEEEEEEKKNERAKNNCGCLKENHVIISVDQENAEKDI